jgi:hypothetical protein
MASPIAMGYLYDYNYRFPYMGGAILYAISFFFFAFVSVKVNKVRGIFLEFSYYRDVLFMRLKLVNVLLLVRDVHIRREVLILMCISVLRLR